MGARITIDIATKEDLPGILEVQKAAFMLEAERIGDYAIAPINQTLDSITEDFHKYTFFKAVYNGTVIGTVKARLEEAGECWLGRLAVLPRCHRQGIGRRLVSAAEEHFPTAETFILFTENDNTKALNLYRSADYSLTGETVRDPGSGLELVKLSKPARGPEKK